LMVIVTLRMNWRGAISLIFGVVGVVVVVGEDMVAVAVVGINGLGVECREAGTLTLLVLLL
jgi:drug/metabolite transporter (DMT)-like permease